MLVNFNGSLVEGDQAEISITNRAVKYGDGVFTTLKYAGGLHFWEDHYFKLMAAMRILRMEIPMNWSPEYLSEQVMDLLQAMHMEKQAARIRLSIYRTGTGRYTPEGEQVVFVVEAEAHPHLEYVLNEKGLVVDLFRDHYLPGGLLSTLKTTNAQERILAGIYAKENNLDAAILMNFEKMVIGATAHNLMVLHQGELKTAPLLSGAQKGVMRGKVMDLAGNHGLTVKEELFSPFDLQRADEVWLTNSITGIQWVGQYRKKTYTNEVAQAVVNMLNQA